MGASRHVKDVLKKLEESIRSKGITVGMFPKISKEVLKEYITIPSKEINLINFFLRTLKRGTRPMPKELASYEVSFNKLIFRCILGKSLEHEVWVAYIKDKHTLDYHHSEI
jgi:hypothetical protein